MITKRTALKAAVAVGAVAIYSGVVPGIGAFAQASLRVRRSVNDMHLDDPDLETYRDFVGLMRNKPESEPVSWVGFANQHGDTNNFKYCPHGDWYFLPWHRAYVEMYENAARVLTNTPKFAMPYWNWTSLRQLPSAFTDKTYKGQPNPLFVPGRGDPPSMVRNPLTGPNALTDALVGPKVIASILKETVYEAFGTSRPVDYSVDPPQVQNNRDPKWVPMGGGNQGILESTPHNNVHNNIGGYMPQSNSPRDPIFMMHHGNIDRIWAHWTALGRKNSEDSLWRDMPFTDNYIAPDGKTYTKVVKDLQDIETLGYTYDDLPKPDNLQVSAAREQRLAALFGAETNIQPTRFKWTATASATASAHLSVPFTLGNAALESVTPSTNANSASRDVVAIISRIKISEDVRAIRVFVNLDSLDQNVPDSDPHYVTTLSFLKHNTSGGMHHMKLPSAIVDLTDTLRRLSLTEGPTNSDKITVQLLPVLAPGAPSGAVGEVAPASIEIALV